MSVSGLLFSANVVELERLLISNPTLANDEIGLPDNDAVAHPLHRICDGVFNQNFGDETGVALAKLFLKHGSTINPPSDPPKDSPLTAACSLHCDELAILYIDHGANISHQGCHGGTALHWSCWTGRDRIVEKLLSMNSEINQRCIDFKSTPLFWALHGYKFGGKNNLHHQIRCAELLLQNRADASIPNFEGYLPKQLIEPNDIELNELFKHL
jgi:uncharacterized protein